MHNLREINFCSIAGMNFTVEISGHFCHLDFAWNFGLHSRIESQKFISRKNLGVNKTLKQEAQTVKSLYHVGYIFVKDSKSNFHKQFHLTFFSRKNHEIKFCNFSWIWFHGKIRENKLNNVFWSWFHVKFGKIRAFHSYFWIKGY